MICDGANLNSGFVFFFSNFLRLCPLILACLRRANEIIHYTTGFWPTHNFALVSLIYSCEKQKKWKTTTKTKSGECIHRNDVVVRFVETWTFRKKIPTKISIYRERKNTNEWCEEMKITSRNNHNIYRTHRGTNIFAYFHETITSCRSLNRSLESSDLRSSWLNEFHILLFSFYVFIRRCMVYVRRPHTHYRLKQLTKSYGNYGIVSILDTHMTWDEHCDHQFITYFNFDILYISIELFQMSEYKLQRIFKHCFSCVS